MSEHEKKAREIVDVAEARGCAAFTSDRIADQLIRDWAQALREAEARGMERAAELALDRRADLQLCSLYITLTDFGDEVRAEAKKLREGKQ